MGAAVEASPKGGKKRGAKPDINITPLVDVVLVLLIIFMVVTPMMTKQFWVLIPKQEEKKVEQASKDDSKKPIVLSVLKDGSIKVNSVRGVRSMRLPPIGWQSVPPIWLRDSEHRYCIVR